MIDADLAVVGAGPAGLAAAAEASARGLSVVLLDDNPIAGGQYFRQPPAALRRAHSVSPDAEHRRAEALFRAIENPRVRHLSDAVVWDAPEPGVLAFTRGTESGRVRAPLLVVASGAVERAVPFPGWTLPGVLTAGGLQNLVKGQRLLPGRRFLVAGNGPLLLVAAHSILRAGGTVVSVADAAAMTGARRHAARLLAAPSLLRRGLGYRTALLRARVSLRTSTTIVEARGADEVTSAVLAPIDPAGRVDRSRAESVEVDTVVAGFGLVPAVELPRLLGCRLHWNALRGGWIPERSADLETTVRNVLAVGDGAGIGGAEVALAEGRLAGLLAAVRAGRSVPDREIARQRATLARLHAVRDAIATLWTPPRSFAGLLTPDTIACRCEEVTVADLTRAIGEGFDSPDPLKAVTRATMGRCQGRNCLATITEMLAHAHQVPVADVEPPRARPPARPIAAADLLHEPLPPPRPPEMILP